MSENPQDPTAPSDQPPAQPYSTSPPPPMGGQTGYGQPAPAYGQQGQAPVSPSDARMWAMFANLGGILFYFVAPLVIYLIYKDRDPFIRRHAAQAMNFQIIVGIVVVVSIPLLIVIIGAFTMTAAIIAFYVFSILAAVAANRGEPYDYPFIPQMIT